MYLMNVMKYARNDAEHELENTIYFLTHNL